MLAGRVPYRRMIAVGLTIAVLAAFGLPVSVLSGLPVVPTLVLFAAFQGSLGPVFSNSTALALANAGSRAGTGSALLGFLRFVLAAVVSPLVGIMGEDTAVPMATAMVTSIVLAVLAFVVLSRRSSTPRDAEADEREPASVA